MAEFEPGFFKDCHRTVTYDREAAKKEVVEPPPKIKKTELDENFEWSSFSSDNIWTSDVSDGKAK